MALPLDTIGKIGNFVWTFENTCFMHKKVKKVLSSPEFLVDSKKWQLYIYPNGCSESHKGYVSVALRSLSQKDKENFILVISFVDYYNKVLFSCMEYVTFSAENNVWKLNRFVEYNEFLSKMYKTEPENELKIKCELLSTISNICTVFNFENLFNSELHSDVKLSVKGEIVYGHKIILSNKSKVYAAMFEHPMKENLDNVVHVEDIEYKVLLEMLRFVYSGRVNNMKNNVKELLIAADKYAINDLKFICDKYLCANLSIDNVVEYLEFADLYSVKALRTSAINFIKSNAQTLIAIPSFKSIVDLHRDLVFEVFRCLVQDQTETGKKADESKEMFSFKITTNRDKLATPLPLSASIFNNAPVSQVQSTIESLPWPSTTFASNASVFGSTTRSNASTNIFGKPVTK